MTVEFRVLGPLDVRDSGGSLPLSARKPRVVLLRLLVDAGTPVPADALADALWGDLPPANAAKLVQIYVSQLRKLLGAETIRTVPVGYLLDVAPGQLDTHRFAHLLADGRRVAAGNAALAASLFRQALDLWRGGAYADVDGEPFAVAEIGRLDELRAECFEERLAAELAAGQGAGVPSEVAALINRYPLRETLRAIQIRALLQAGRRADALDAYQEARRVLRDELGLDPGPQLRAAHQLALRTGPDVASSAAPAAVRRLPEPPTPLIGRERELAELQQLLSRPDVRLLTLTGAGGSGKTRLALALARLAGNRYANGVALVELAPLRDAGLVLSAIAEALGVQPSPGGDVLVEWLAERELLLVVDNVEHLPEAFPVLAALVARAPRLTVVVTGRRVMHVSGEHVYPVAPLADYAAADLFVQRARAAHAAFAADRGDPDVAAVCRRLDGLPLAIELAAARVATLPTKTLLERLSSRLTVLTVGPHDLPARQRTLRQTLEWSANLLTPKQRTALARLSVFPAGCTLECAERFVGADLDTLAALVDDNLLRTVDTGAGARFVMLETIREYADTQLGDDRDAAEQALVSYCVDLVSRVRERGPEQPRWLALLDAEHDNIRVALTLAGDTDTRLAIVGGMWRYWWVRGHLHEGTTHVLAALAGADGAQADGSLHAKALYGAAGLSWAAGSLGEARRFATEASRRARDCGNTFVLMAANTCLGEIAMKERDWTAARRHHEEALTIARANQWPIDVVTSELNLAAAIMETGDLETARRMLTNVLTYHRDNDIVEGIGFASLALGEVAYRMADHPAMTASFTDALDAFASIGFDANAAYAMQGLAAATVHTADPAEAAHLLGAAAAIVERTGDENGAFAPIAAHAESAAITALGEQRYREAFDAGRDGRALRAPAGH